MIEKIQLKEKVFGLLPLPLSREIESLTGVGDLCEIRIRRLGHSSVVLKDRALPLAYSARDSIDSIFMSVCRGTPYAYRDSIAKGYVPLFDGIRVGVAGRARYEEDKLIGVTDVSSLVFRFPTERCDFAEELLGIWNSCSGGLLVFSPPCGGKTTALRSLARGIASGRGARRVVIVDEREEIFTDGLSGLEIDVLSGYRRAYGISLATRTLSPEVIITDEIATEDSEALLRCANCGVPIVASAHAGSIEELMRRTDIARLAERGVFTSFVALGRENGRFVCKEVSL